MWTYTTDSMDFVTVSTGLILPYWMGLPIRYIQVIGTFRYEEQSYKSCNGILHLCKNNPKVFSDTAAKTCLESHIYNYTHFKKQLYNLMNQKKTNSSGTLPEHKNIRGKSHYE